MSSKLSRVWGRGRALAELYGNAIVMAGDWAGGSGRDLCHVRAEQQGQAASDAGSDLDAVVKQQPGGQVPALAVLDRGSGVPRPVAGIKERAVTTGGDLCQELVDVAGSQLGGQEVLGVGLLAGPCRMR